MQTVTFDGVEYTKATQVAKQFGYTSDYLGQLCRAKKINARLVGRSWFVNVPSLEAHRDGKYQKKAQTQVTEESANRKKEDPETDSAQSGSTSKRYLKRVLPPSARIRRPDSSVSSRAHYSHSQLYAPDTQELLPSVTKSPKVTLLKVAVAESESLPILSQTKAVSKLQPSPLPDVALSGSVTVEDITPDEPISTPDKKSLSRDIHKNKVKIKIKDDAHQKVSSYNKKSTSNSFERRKKIKTGKIVISENDTLTGVTVAAKPSQVVKADVSKTNPSFKILLLTTAVALLFAVVTLSLGQVGIVSDGVASFDFDFSWKNTANIFVFLFTG